MLLNQEYKVLMEAKMDEIKLTADQKIKILELAVEYSICNAGDASFYYKLMIELLTEK